MGSERGKINPPLQEDLIMRATTKTTLASKVASTKTAPAAKKAPATAKRAAPAAKGATTKNAATAPVSAPPAWTLPTVPNGFGPPSGDVARRQQADRADARRR